MHVPKARNARTAATRPGGAVPAPDSPKLAIEVGRVRLSQGSVCPRALRPGSVIVLFRCCAGVPGSPFYERAITSGHLERTAWTAFNLGAAHWQFAAEDFRHRADRPSPPVLGAASYPAGSLDTGSNSWVVGPPSTQWEHLSYMNYISS